MSGIDDKRELSGLARSIDALFSGASRGATAAPASEPERAEPEAPRAEPETWLEPPETEPTLPAVEPAGEPADPTIDPTAGPAIELDVEAVEPLTRPAGIAEPTWEAEASPLAWDELTLVPEEPPPFEAAAVDQEATELEITEAAAPHIAEQEPGEAAAGPRVPAPDGLPRAVEAFLAGAPGAGAEVRALAADLRGRLALDPVADAVERLVREAGTPPDPSLLDMASAIIDPAVASRIVQRIGHERDAARKADYLVLCQRLGVIMAKSFRGALTGATEPAARRAYYDALIAMGDTSRPFIEEMVEDENSLLVCSGVALLREMGGDGAKELVTSALAHPDPRVRKEALLALAKLGDDESGTLVVGFLDDPERDVRVAAATAAGALKVGRALRPLLERLDAEGESEHEGGVIPFIDALGELGDPGAVPAIEKHAVKSLFSKPDTEVRVAAYRALHEIGTPHARELVQKALSDKEPAVRAAVRRIVGSSAEA